MTIPAQTAQRPAVPTATTTRSALRGRLLECRNALDQSQKNAADATIRQRIVAYCSSMRLTLIGGYWAIQNEPDLQSVYLDLAATGVQLALPVVIDRDAPLRFARWTPGDALAVGIFGVPVPATSIWVQPQALLVPCLGVSATRIRLGYGGGFYDRTLATAPRPTTIGIAYACAIAEFEPGPHDVALDRIITEGACW